MTPNLKTSLLAILLAMVLGCGGGGGVSTAPQSLYDKGKETVEQQDEIPVMIGETLDELGAPEAADVENELDVEKEERVEDTGAQCPGSPSCPCSSNDECFSGFCVETMEGNQCTNKCLNEGDCPNGWQCVVCGSLGSDYQFCCVSPFQRLCRPCRTDEDCIPSIGALDKKYACIAFAPEEGRFCGVECDDDAQCPRGFKCMDVGAGEKQCYPDDGTCPCPDHYKQFVTDCYKTNSNGTCYGTRHCDTECSAKTPAPEACNMEDDNCDGATDEEGALGCQTFYYDNDNDGYGVGGNSKCLCSPSGSYRATRGDDCDDMRVTVNPGAQELCANGIDDDCDGQTDEAGCQGCITYYRDSDNDGYGVASDSLCSSAPQGEYRAVVSGDCDDNDPQVYPGAGERCNSKDDNCNGQTDEEGAQGCIPYFFDYDADGWGITLAKCLCAPDPQTKFTAPVSGDCNDNDALISPSAQERCNSKDDNCNGQVDEERQGEECGTGGYAIFYLDADGDGYGVTGVTKCLCNAQGNFRATKGDDCDDGDPSINPGASERCGGKDENCNGETDEEGARGCTIYFYDYDGDGYGISVSKCLCAPDTLTKFTALFSGDCNDNDASVNPSAVEKCNGKDDDCNGQVDEERITLQCGTDGYKTFYFDGDNDTYGLSEDAKCLCTAQSSYKATKGGDCDDNDPQVNPGASEKCNNKDDNCDGRTDEVWPQKGQACDGLDSDLCKEGKFVCKADGSDVECDDKTGDNVEVCDLQDNDCDGETDEEGAQGCTVYYFDMDNDTYGITGDSKCLCAPSGNYLATRGGDCDDRDGAVNPGAQEKCNNKDDNCDGFIDEERTTGGCGTDGYNTYFFDRDKDGFGQDLSKCLCAPQGYFTAPVNGDCNDNDAGVNPSVIEKCNGKDDNCDGQVDEERVLGECEKDGYSTWYRDNDNDTYGMTEDKKCLCAPSPPYRAPRGGDCDDADPGINPGQPEVCNNSKDDNCNGQTDEAGCQGCTTYYKDEDQDGYGVAGDTKCLSEPLAPYTAANGADCNDRDANINPASAEICDQKDNDCDGQTDEEGAQGCVPYFYDFDGDNFGIPFAKCLCAPDPQTKFTATVSGDCNDNDAGINPSAIEKCNNKDDDCDGQTDEERTSGQCGIDGYTLYYYDGDYDTYGVTGDTKCLCSPSGRYNVTRGGDCDDQDKNVHPGATERCDGKDNDCDGFTDPAGSQGCITYYYDADNDTYGTSQSQCLCSPSGNFRATRSGDCDDAQATINPGQPEVCNNSKDDNCDGQTDEEGAQGCKLYFKDQDQDGFGISTDTKCLCVPVAPYTSQAGGDCDDSDPSVNPRASEACNGKDDDCDGQTDEEGAQGCVPYFYDFDGDNFGIPFAKCLCAPDPQTKFTAPVSGDCNDNDAGINPSATEKCDGKDNDCDQQVDEERTGGECGVDGYRLYYFDGDLDTYYANPQDFKCLCAPSGNYKGITPGDCDDADPNVHPGAIEKCNGKDDDCNRLVDEERTSGQCGIDGYTLYYYDGDGDTYGDTQDTKCLCSPSGKYNVTRGGDCNDVDPRAHPGAPAVCGIDADCDGSFLDPGEVCDDGNSVRWDGCTDCLYLEFQVNTWTTDNQSGPSITSLPNGGFVVVWSSDGQDGSGYGVYGQRFDANGNKVGSEFQVNTWTTDDQSYPSITSLSNGGFVVVWSSAGQDPSAGGVYGQRFDSNGGKVGSEFQVNTWTTDDQSGPSITSLSNGGFVVVWESNGQDGSGYGVYGQRFDSNGNNVGSEFQVNTWTTNPQSYPSVTSLSNGGFVVVWSSSWQDGSYYGLYGQRFDSNGNKVGSEFRVNTWTTDYQENPSITSLPNGGFLVVWQSGCYPPCTPQDGSYYGVYGQRFDSNGNKVGSEFRVNTWTTDYQSDPSITSLPDGGFVVVWESNGQDGSYSGVYGQRFDANGNKVGSEFQVNTWTTDWQQHPSITSLSNGGFVVVWDSNGQDGSSSGVYGRIFSQ